MSDDQTKERTDRRLGFSTWWYDANPVGFPCGQPCQICETPIEKDQEVTWFDYRPISDYRGTPVFHVRCLRSLQEEIDRMDPESIQRTIRELETTLGDI